MILTCENCNTSFNLDENLLKPTGSKVRCSQCRHIFTAFPPPPPETEAPPAAVPPEPEVEEPAPPPAETAEAADAEVTPDVSMDFQEEAEEFPAAAETQETPLAEEESTDAGEEMELGIDLEPEAEAPVEDELDLSDVEGLLDEEVPP